jgi:uncharacterized damage-inducible protein DinB
MLRELLLSKWSQVRLDLVTTIDKFSDDELSYRPFPNAYTAGELMLHIANEEAIEIQHGTIKALAEFPQPYDPQQFRDKASIYALLNEVHEPTVEYLKGKTDAGLEAEIELPWGGISRPIDMLWHALEHEIHHRGELSLILGLLGREGLDA